MITLRAIAGRLCISVAGPVCRISGEMTLDQARALRCNLDEVITMLDLGEERPDTLVGLIEQCNGVGA